MVSGIENSAASTGQKAEGLEKVQLSSTAKERSREVYQLSFQGSGSLLEYSLLIGGPGSGFDVRIPKHQFPQRGRSVDLCRR